MARRGLFGSADFAEPELQARGLHVGILSLTAPPVRTLILLGICSLFVGFAVLDARGRGRGSRRMLVEAILALGVGLAVCYFLVYVVGIFDDWKYSFRH